MFSGIIPVIGPETISSPLYMKMFLVFNHIPYTSREPEHRGLYFGEAIITVWLKELMISNNSISSKSFLNTVGHF